jgi:hypothetical protein
MKLKETINLFLKILHIKYKFEIFIIKRTLKFTLIMRLIIYYALFVF